MFFGDFLDPCACPACIMIWLVGCTCAEVCRFGVIGIIVLCAWVVHVFSMARHQTGSKKRRNQARVTEKTAAVQETIDTAERERVEALEQAEYAERLDLRIVFHGAFPSQSYVRTLKYLEHQC